MTFDDWCAAYGGGWHDAAQWLRDNYQDHQTIAGLCDAMVAAAPVQRKPLTEDEIDKLMQRIGLRCADEGNPLMTNHAEWQRRTIARAIELARDIKGGGND